MDRDTQQGLFRLTALALGIGALALVTWIGTIPKGIDRGAGYVESTGSSSAGYGSGAAPVVYREVKTGGEPCNSFEGSPYAVEAMIDEMVSRGWKPPTQRDALASTQPVRGAPIKALDPDAPVPIAPPRQSAPVTTAPDDGTTPPADAGSPPSDTGASPAPPAAPQPAPVPPAPRPPATSLPG